MLSYDLVHVHSPCTIQAIKGYIEGTLSRVFSRCRKGGQSSKAWVAANQKLLPLIWPPHLVQEVVSSNGAWGSASPAIKLLMEQSFLARSIFKLESNAINACWYADQIKSLLQKVVDSAWTDESIEHYMEEAEKVANVCKVTHGTNDYPN